MHLPKRPRHERAISVNARVARNINRALILNTIRERQPISRAQIAEITNLNKSTVSSIVETLHAEEIIAQEAAKGRAVGRNPINLRLRTGRHYVGALSFDSAATQAAIVDLDGSIKYSVELPTIPNPPDAFIARCVEELATLRKRHHLPHFRGIGVTVAGIVDSFHSKVVFAPNLGWDGVDIGAFIRKHAPEVGTIVVENDAKASALAELWFGRHDINLSNFVFLSVGRGIGTGIVIDRRVINGESHAAGEFGHTTLIEGGEPCACGNLGCWEAYASDRATAKRYADARGITADVAAGLTIRDIIAAARAGEVLAREHLVTTGRYLGIGIANIIKAVDPDAIVIGGKITEAWEYIFPAITDILGRRAYFGKQRNTAILPTSLHARPSLLGAAALPIRQFFTDLRVTV